MNVERLTMIRDKIAQIPDELFNMRTFGKAHDCGTAACIGGWGERLFEKELEALLATKDKIGWQSPDVLVELLGLSRVEGEDLFYATRTLHKGLHLGDITREDALLTLRNLIEKGFVNWSHVEVTDV